MSTIPELNDTECWVVRTAVTERYGKRVELQPTDRDFDSILVPPRSPFAQPGFGPSATLNLVSRICES